MANAAATATNQYALTWLQFAVTEQALPCHERGKRHCARVNGIDASGFSRDVSRLNRHVFREAAAVGT